MEIESKQEKSQKIRRFWKVHLEKWAESGLSQSEYCRRHNLSRHRFSYWKARIKPKNLPIELAQVPVQPSTALLRPLKPMVSNRIGTLSTFLKICRRPCLTKISKLCFHNRLKKIKSLFHCRELYRNPDPVKRCGLLTAYIQPMTGKSYNRCPAIG